MYIYLFLIFLTFSEEELDFLKVKKIPLEELNINTKMDDIDRKMIEFYQKEKGQSCSIAQEDIIGKQKEFFYDGLFYSGKVDIENKPTGIWEINSNSYECYETDKYLFISKNKKIYENKLNKYNITFLPDENLSYLEVVFMINQKVNVRNYILKEGKVIKIEKNPYAFNDEKFILKRLKENDYQEFSY